MDFINSHHVHREQNDVVGCHNDTAYASIFLLHQLKQHTTAANSIQQQIFIKTCCLGACEHDHHASGWCAASILKGLLSNFVLKEKVGVDISSFAWRIMAKFNFSNKASPLLFMILVSVIYSPFTDGITLGDMALLRTLRESLLSKREAIPSWFHSETSPCNWTGIQCEGFSVSKIDLSDVLSHLNLPFPDLIGEFRSLKYLNLSYCSFIGGIPQNFWSLENLESLDLSANKLAGVLPPTLSNLKGLRELVLDDNSFYGTLPAAIGKLKNLKELSIRGNSFSGNLPDELGNLRNLQSLDLSMNMFSGSLPTTLGELTRLLYLDASKNKLTGPLLSDIGNLRLLRTLDLSLNSLSGPIPKTISYLKELQVLDLPDCKFSGHLPEELCELSSLTSLNLAQNDLQGELPECFGKLSNLVYLIAPSAGLSGEIPKQLGNCKRLKNINLSFNLLSGSLPDSLAGMESATSVLLGSNRLSGPFPEWISNWKQVETISLSKNLLTGSLPPLNIPLLSYLDLSSNKLSGELQADICNAKLLISLDLSDNKFMGSIGKTFMNCFSLTDLVLSENALSGEIPGYLGELQLITLELSKNKFFGKIPDQLWESKTLMEIYLNNNILQGSIPGAIAKVSTLQRLQLDNNLFEGMIPVSIGKLSNLTNLSIHGNKLTGKIPLEIFGCTKLVSLDLGANRMIGPIPKALSQLKFLDNLVLSNNQFSGSIPEEICSGFQKVPLPDSEFMQHYGMLDLSHNELEGPIPESIEKCTVLAELFLQGNKLSGSIPYSISNLANIISLDLSFNFFSGSLVPQLFSMQKLQGLFLSHNKISGPIPKNFESTMSSLTKLDLSDNLLSGSLPPSLLHIKSLTVLDVSKNSLSGALSIDSGTTNSLSVLNASNNKFSGVLDDSFYNLTSLSVLDIHNNSLTGTLPSSLSNLAALTYLDLSNNDFQNSFPCNICDIEGLSYVNFSGNRFMGNMSETCEAEICLKNQNVFSSKHDYRIAPEYLTRASVLGIALGATVISMVLLLGLLRWRILRQEAANLDKGGKDKFVLATEPASSDELLVKKPKEPLSINIATFQHSLLRINPADILTATENFSKDYIIGDGGFGTVYKASLPGKTLAVKRLNGGHLHGDREFLAEMETIGKVKHENLVRLLGYCVFADERFLIYDYMENGSLDFWLRNEADAIQALDWPTRFKICLGAARGLAFLHHGFVPHIIHRDIKSSNILLDTNFEPRVSDFGLARIISACETHVSTVLAGTFGYIPPEYGQTMIATIKGDVYSFGVVILELLTGKAPTGQTDIEGGNLVGWVRRMTANGKEPEILDPSISGSTFWKDQMLNVLAIARRCTSDEPWKRPTMLEVVKLLKETKAKIPAS